MAPNNFPTCTSESSKKPRTATTTPRSDHQFRGIPHAPASPQRAAASPHPSPRSTGPPQRSSIPLAYPPPPSPTITLMHPIVADVPKETSRSLGLTNMSPGSRQQKRTAVLWAPLATTTSAAEAQSSGRSGERLLRPRALDPEETPRASDTCGAIHQNARPHISGRR